MSWLRDVDRWLCDAVLPHEASFRALAYRVAGNREVARDIVQEVYAELLSGERWRTARDPKAFVLRIVYCRSVDWLNDQKVVPIHELPSYESLAHADGAPDAFDVLAGREELSAVLEALDALPPRCRQVVTLRRFQDLSPPEIARRLGLAVDTVDRHLARGLTLLCQRLGDRVSPGRRTIPKTKNTAQVE